MTPPMMGPGDTLLFEEELPVDWASIVTAACVEVDVKEVKKVDPSEVTSELVVKMVGGGVEITTDMGVVVVVVDVVDIVDDGSVVSVEVDGEDEGEDEGEEDGEEDRVDVGVDVGVEEGDVEGEEISEHEDPKRVVTTVTGTSTVNVVGTVTVVVLP